MRIHTLFATLCFCGIAHAHDFARSQHKQGVHSLEQAAVHLSKYRETGDDAWLTALDPFFKSTPTNESTPQWHLLRAWHKQAQHKFAEALQSLEPLAKAARPQVDVALLYANTARVMGGLADANLACRHVSTRQPTLGQLCSAHVRLSQGTKPSLHELSKLSALMAFAPRDKRYRAWAHATIAQLAASANDAALAISSATQALALEPTVTNQAALANLLVDLNKPTEALDTLRASSSQAPAIVLARLRASASLGSLVNDAALTRSLDHTFRHWIANGDLLHAREMAIFYLEIVPDPNLAKRLAQANWEVQREYEDQLLLTRTANL